MMTSSLKPSLQIVIAPWRLHTRWAALSMVLSFPLFAKLYPSPFSTVHPLKYRMTMAMAWVGLPSNSFRFGFSCLGFIKKL